MFCYLFASGGVEVFGRPQMAGSKLSQEHLFAGVGYIHGCHRGLVQITAYSNFPAAYRCNHALGGPLSMVFGGRSSPDLEC
jgi:hypothetical protein